MPDNTCVRCGAVIPEGRQTCPACSRAAYDPAEFFSAERVRTNADLLRAMSDAELADLIGCNSLCEHIQFAHPKWCQKYEVCGTCLTDWLKSPAKASA